MTLSIEFGIVPRALSLAIALSAVLLVCNAALADPSTDATLTIPPQNQPAKSTTKPKAGQRPHPRRPVAKPATSLDRHFFASFLYSSANRVNYQGSTPLFGVPTPVTATESTNAAFGVAGGYISRHENGFGYSGELTFEFVRNSNGITGNAGSAPVTGSYVGNGGTNIWSSELNVNYTFGTDFFLFLGPNYPLTFLNKGTDDLQGLIGYQGGLGYALSDHFTLQGGYRVLRMKGSFDVPGLTLTIDQATMPGFVIGVQYLF